MDKAERSGTNLGIILLDWEKAFDKISHSSLLHTMRRYRLPPRFLNLLTNIYKEPNFYVSLQKTTSDTHAQHSGIRQGCPLSPYLFVMVMSALWTDLHKAIPTASKELLYADDTLLYSTSPKKLETTLRQVETESHRYGLALNYNKCEFIGINFHGLRTPQIH